LETWLRSKQRGECDYSNAEKFYICNYSKYNSQLININVINYIYAIISSRDSCFMLPGIVLCLVICYLCWLQNQFWKKNKEIYINFSLVADI